MVQKTIVQLTDDLDGSEAIRTVRFSVPVAGTKDRSTVYDIDLSEKNLQKFIKAMEPFAAVGRFVTGYSPDRPYDKEEAGRIRAWAEKEGLLKEGARGRIPVEVVRKYRTQVDG